jgi:hypothetical protein
MTNAKQTKIAQAINVTTPTTFSNVAEKRELAIQAENKTYGARIDYAIALNGIAVVAWYDIEENGGKLPENIQAEKDAYYAGLKAINYSNPSNAWKMIKKYAKANAQTNALFGEVAPIETEAKEEKGANANKERPLDLRLIQELVSLYKACVKTEDLSKKQAGALDGIKVALKAMGVDLSLIK